MNALERLWYEPPRVAGRIAGVPLSGLAALFGSTVRLRNWLFDRGLLRAERVDGLFVISVGNLVLGGAGKTPAVIAVCERLAGAGRKVAVLSRGYGRTERAPMRVDPAGPAERYGDEPLLIARRCPSVEVFVGPRRAELARLALARGAEVAVLDDGMQHRRLARDLEIVVVDAATRFGNGRLLPAGPLREPQASLHRADLVWLRDGRERLPGVEVPHVFAEHRPTALMTATGPRPLETLAGHRVLALCGIARPDAFVRTLKQLGADLADLRAFPDHHRFTPGELASAREQAARLGAQLVTTEKDAVRLPAGFDAWVVQLSAVLLDAALLDERLGLSGASLVGRVSPVGQRAP
jgi:tetraacyldisaccharide 4'-kinase